MKKINLNWQHLGFVEYASGIEVYHASLFFRKDKFIQKRILDHSLDEYRHSNYFYELSKKKQKREQISTPVGLIEIGGLSKSPFPASKNKIISICSYLYVGELRAIKFGETVNKNYNDNDVLEIFKIIDKDEKNHARGLMNFLKNKNKFTVTLNVFQKKLKFRFSDNKSFGLYAKLKTKAEKFLIKSIFRIFPDSIFETEDLNTNFENIYKNRKRMT